MTVQATRGPYSDVIRERWRRPKFRGELPGANAVAEDVNPLCGDRVRLMLRLVGGRVAGAKFTGDSCAICAASADVVVELIDGRPVAEARRVDTADVLSVLQADIRPTRMRCVTLPLSVLATALNGGASRDGSVGEASGEKARGSGATA
jgi:nitrogen fixation NifU-like protein